jgi:hypothetical protein
VQPVRRAVVLDHALGREPERPRATRSDAAFSTCVSAVTESMRRPSKHAAMAASAASPRRRPSARTLQ